MRHFCRVLATASAFRRTVELGGKAPFARHLVWTNIVIQAKIHPAAR